MFSTLGQMIIISIDLLRSVSNKKIFWEIFDFEKAVSFYHQ